MVIFHFSNIHPQNQSLEFFVDIWHNHQRLFNSRPAFGRPRPKIYGYCRSGYISQKFEGSAPDLDFTYTRSNISQKFGESAPDLDFTHTRSNISQKSGGLHQIWTLHILEGIFHKNLGDLHQIWTLHILEVIFHKNLGVCTRFGLYIY